MTSRQMDAEAEILELARDIHRRAGPSRSSPFDRVMESAMEDEELKADLFRLLDVLPSLASDGEVSRHVREYLLGKPRSLPAVLAAALRAAGTKAFAGIASRAIHSVASQMAERFIIGASVPDALPSLAGLHHDGLAFSADLLGEATLSDVEGAAYLQRYSRLIDTLSQETAAWEARPLVDADHRGQIPRAHVSLKLSSLSPRLDPLDHVGSVDRLAARLHPLFLEAKRRGVSLVIDMEQWDLHNIAWDLFEELVTRSDLSAWPHFGIVVQAYLEAARTDVQRLLSIARHRGAPLTVRLVKGAYWDYEVAHARQHGYPCPVLLGKGRSDASFESLAELLMQSTELVSPGIASHNLRSISHAIVAARRASAPRGSFELQCLFGMADAQRDTLRDMGCRVRVYSPIGELLPGIAYLVRRLLENSANTGFLRQSTHDKRPIEELAARPAPEATPSAAAKGATPFENCPLADFTDPRVRAGFAAALSRQRAVLPVAVPVCVGGERVGGTQLTHWCPGNRRQEAAVVTCATRDDVERAVGIAEKEWPDWRDTSIEHRAACLEKLAHTLERDRFDLAALQCLEVGKPVREADADVAEAIDMCRYYSRAAAAELAPRRRADIMGEDNLSWYEGWGVAAIIAPWNFPLAILCGMTAAALVAGNTVIMKPAEQSSATALRLFHALEECGVPPGVVQLLPGAGEEVGAALVAHPRVVLIAFTGSRDVGTSILAQAARVTPGQVQLKRVVCEMGGKNAIIVDDDADLDEAVAGVLKSAFGYAGQKCSACSRLIVLEGVYDRMLPRLVDAVRSIRIAAPEDPSCELGPVIDEAAWRRLDALVRQPGNGVEPLFVGSAAPETGWYVPPAIFAVKDPDQPMARQELFGPLLSVFRAESFARALQMANDSQYALTGGVYSRSPSRIDMARRQFRVGNLYVNREITGAMADRQPFGGLRMSGGGTKAGGPGYLLHFAAPRVATENTMRKGFAP
ncbi:MAG: proline dehydrogenase family protein [Spirochaetia bacterium]